MNPELLTPNHGIVVWIVLLLSWTVVIVLVARAAWWLFSRSRRDSGTARQLQELSSRVEMLETDLQEAEVNREQLTARLDFTERLLESREPSNKRSD